MALSDWARFNHYVWTTVGQPAMDLPLADFCDISFGWALRNLDERGASRFERDLLTPPATLTISAPEAFDEGPWSAEAEMDGFLALTRQTKRAKQ